MGLNSAVIPLRSTRWQHDVTHAQCTAHFRALFCCGAQELLLEFRVESLPMSSCYRRGRADEVSPRLLCRRCDERGCDGLLRPDVIWFGETLDSHVLTKVEKELDACDLCLLVRSVA